LGALVYAGWQAIPLNARLGRRLGLAALTDCWW
jgi:hypothetical protein